MKTTLLILALTSTALFAQDVSPDSIDTAVAAAAKVLPPAYAAYLALALQFIPLFGRGWTAWKNNGGARGIWNAVVNGISTPPVKLLVGAFALLGLSSCATTSAVLASSFGRAVIATADQLAKQVLVANEVAGLGLIISKATAARDKLVEQGVNADAAKETLRQFEIVNLEGVITLAEFKYKEVAGKDYSAPKNPPLKPVSP
ncbi:MAG: hypothetical protein J0L73_28420 [Verrucomicrobia bacterium]|nr:hypothetical protein [Verrucomicrobiota bacterium]